MQGWKVYIPDIEEDGAVYWRVEGKVLNYITYHATHNLDEFYDWSRKSRERAWEWDQALSILADYFEEHPTKEQLDNRQCKCWKYHVAFWSEVSSRGQVIDAEEIDLWLAYKERQYSQEKVLMELLDRLSLPISIKESNSDNGEYIWKFLDGKGIGYDFMDALKNALEYNMFQIRSRNIFR